MKIVHIHDMVVPGLGYQENMLPAKIHEEGHDIEVITSTIVPRKFKDDYDNFEEGEEIINGVKYHRLDHWIHVEDIGKVVFKNLEKKLGEIEPDVIQCRSTINAYAARSARYCKYNDAHLFIDEHIDNDNFHLDKFYKKAGFLLFKWALLGYIEKEAELFLPVQTYSQEFLNDKFNIPISRTEVLPLGVETEHFQPDDEEGNEIRSELDIANDEFLLVTAGNIDPRKDIEVLVEAFAELNDNHELKLLILGRPSGPEGPRYFQEIKDMVEREGLTTDVVFHDFVPHEELSKYYNAADIGVWPGKLGITTVEAMGTGLPILICNSRATEYIISNDNGLAFERGNASELADKLSKYISDGSLLEKYAINAESHARQNLSWDAIAEKNISIYKEYMED